MNRIGLALVLACACLSMPAHAAFIYDNTVNATGSVGILGDGAWSDDVHMTSAGDMTEFSFRYIANGATEATIRFYTNDAMNSFWPGDGSSLLHTEVVTLSGASGLETVTLGTPVVLPQHIWISIQFNGSSAAVPLFTAPVVGTSDPEVVSFSGFVGAFFGSGVNSFPFSVSATEVPEPAAALLLLPGLFLLRFARRPRSSS